MLQLCNKEPEGLVLLVIQASRFYVSKRESAMCVDRLDGTGAAGHHDMLLRTDRTRFPEPCKYRKLCLDRNRS